MRRLSTDAEANDVGRAVHELLRQVVATNQTQRVVERHGADAVLVLDDSAVVERDDVIFQVESSDLLAEEELVLRQLSRNGRPDAARPARLRQ